MSWSRAGQREFLGLLERRVDWRGPGLAGTTFPEGDGRPELAVYSSLRRGWFFGSEEGPARSFLECSQSGPRELRRPMVTTGPNSTTTQRNGRAGLFGQRSEHPERDLATLRRARKGDGAKAARGHDSKENDPETGLDRPAVDNGDSRRAPAAWAHGSGRRPRHGPRPTETVSKRAMLND